MARKKSGKRTSGDTRGGRSKKGTAAPSPGDLASIAREIGEKQKTLRELKRKGEKSGDLRKARKGSTKGKFRKSDTNVLFIGGRTDDPEAGGFTDAFSVIDKMLSRKPMTDEDDIAQYHRAGKKKGQKKFRGWGGGMKERNEKLLRKYTNKKVRLHVYFDVITGDGDRTSHRAERDITYREYRDIVDAYAEAIRSAVDRDSDEAYFVRKVTFTAVAEPRKRTRKKSQNVARKSGKGSRGDGKRKRSVRKPVSRPRDERGRFVSPQLVNGGNADNGSANATAARKKRGKVR